MTRFAPVVWLLVSLVAAQEQLRFSIADALVEESEGGGALRPSFRFQPGDVFYVAFRIAGYSRDEQGRVSLRYRIDARDSDNRPLAQSVTGNIEKELSLQDKNWMPRVIQPFPLPSLMLPGTATVTITAEDTRNGNKASAELRVPIGGRVVEPSETLVVRNFRLLPSDEDAPRGIDPPVLPAGAPIRARFEITGYRFGEGNRHAVSYGISVIDSTGKVLLNDPVAAREEGTGFYPRPYVPGALALQFTPPLAAGDYTLVIAVNDDQGKHKIESRHTFSVR